ncbi:MAG: MFS transporter [Xanthobacteraceae bacterium]
MIAIALFNIGVQLSAPRWVAGSRWQRFRHRSPAAWRSAAGCGGHVANGAGVSETLLISGGVMLASPLIGFWLRMPAVDDPSDAAIRHSPIRSQSCSDDGAQRADRDRDRIPHRRQSDRASSTG